MPANPQNPGIIDPDRDPATVRAAVLTRLSEWVDGTSSPARQREDGIELVQRHGWNFDPETDVFEDIDISGWKPDVRRPGLEALLSRLDDYDVIVFWKLDRVFRSVERFLAFLGECEKGGTGLVSVKEPFLDTTSPIGRLIALVLMAIAEMESTNTSIRVRSARDYFAKKGRRMSFAPYGWRLLRDSDGRTTTMVLDPIRSPVLSKVVSDYLEGSSLPQLADDLNARQVPSPRGGLWHESTLRRLLTNPVLVGQHVHRDQVVLDDQGVPITPHEALVDLWTWTRLQDELKRRSSRRSRGRRDQRLLRGLVRCATCGRPMHASGVEGSNDATYECGKTRMKRQACPKSNCISQRRLDAYVEQWLFGYLTDEVMGQAVALREQEREMLSRPSPNQQRRQQLLQALDRLEEDRSAGLYDAELAKQRYRSQHRELTDEISKLGPEPTALSSLTGLPELTGSVEAVWNDLTREVKSRILHAVIDRIEIRHRLTKSWKFDPNRVSIVPRRLEAPDPLSVDTEMQKAAS